MENERIVYVAYCTKRRQFQGRSGYTDDFSNARIFNKRGHLSSSVGRHNIENGKVTPIPIKMMIDEDILISLKLGATEDMLFN